MLVRMYSTGDWVPNANEMSTNNMKCTWPARKFCVGDPAQPIFHWHALGVTQILAFLDTTMLVSPTKNCGVGGLSQRQDPTQMVLRCSGI